MFVCFFCLFDFLFVPMNSLYEIRIRGLRSPDRCLDRYIHCTVGRLGNTAEIKGKEEADGWTSGHNSKLDEAIATKLIYNQRETTMYTIVILKVAAVTCRIRDNE